MLETIEPLDDLDRSVIVAVSIVGMVQVAIDEIIDMVAMRDWFMSTALAVDMASLVASAVVRRCASLGISSRHG